MSRRKSKNRDLTTALFRVTRNKTGLAVHRDARGKIIEQREIPYITQQQLDGEDLLASIVSTALAGTVMFLGFKFGQELGERLMHPEKYPRREPPISARDGEKASRASSRRAAVLRFDYVPARFEYGLSVDREWLHRRLPAELAASELQEIEIVEIPRRFRAH